MCGDWRGWGGWGEEQQCTATAPTIVQIQFSAHALPQPREVFCRRVWVAFFGLCHFPYRSGCWFVVTTDQYLILFFFLPSTTEKGDDRQVQSEAGSCLRRAQRKAFNQLVGGTMAALLYLPGCQKPGDKKGKNWRAKGNYRRGEGCALTLGGFVLV